LVDFETTYTSDPHMLEIEGETDPGELVGILTPPASWDVSGKVDESVSAGRDM